MPDDDVSLPVHRCHFRQPDIETATVHYRQAGIPYLIGRDGPQIPSAAILHSKPGILPCDLDENIDRKDLLTITDIGDVQQTDPHRYLIGLAARVGPRAGQVTVSRRRLGLCGRDA